MAEGRTGRGWRGRGAPGKVTVNTQQGTFASDPFCWGVPRRAFLPTAPHPLAEPYSHPRMPPGSIILALEGALWAPSPSGGQEDLGCLCSRQRHCLGCPSCWQWLETADPRASGVDVGSAVLLPSPCTKVLEALGGNFPLFPFSQRARVGTSPLSLFFPSSQRPRVMSLPFPLWW